MFGSRYQKIGLPHAVQLSRGLLGVPVERPIKELSFDLDVKPYLLDELSYEIGVRAS